MATMPDQNNNKDRFHPNGKRFKNAIQITPYYKNDSNQELHELLPARKAKFHERQETLT